MTAVDHSSLRAQILPATGGWFALDPDGGLSPLRGRLPAAAGRFPAPPPRPARRSHVPDGAFVTVTRLVPRQPRGDRPAARTGSAVILPLEPRRLARKHKLMLALAAMILVLGAANAHRTWRAPAVMVEQPARAGHDVAGAPGVAAPQNPLL
ncbi:MAG: hypothetical protein PGN34_22380 [Methylobacterium frigidaeris]